MQTAKATLLVLVCVALLGACGLKGPLYLPGETPASQPAIEQDPAVGTDAAENGETPENNEKKKPVSG